MRKKPPSFDIFEQQDSPWRAILDWDKVSPPLVVRSRQEGDRFRPLGMDGKKLISDYLIDEKVPIKFKSGLVGVHEYIIRQWLDVCWQAYTCPREEFTISCCDGGRGYWVR